MPFAKRRKGGAAAEMRAGGVLGLAVARGGPASPPASSPPPGFVRPTFEQLYASVHRWLPDELRRLGTRNVNVEDLLHDVMLIAHRGLEHFDPSASLRREHDDSARALRAWVRGIAWRLVDKRRKAASLRAVRLGEIGADIAHVPHGVPRAEHVVAAGDRRRIWITLLATIKPCRADVFVLHEMAEWSAAEIAQALGIKVNTVKSRLNRGRRDILQAIKRLPAEQRSALQEALVPSEGGGSLLPEVGMAEGLRAFQHAVEQARRTKIVTGWPQPAAGSAP